MEKKRRPIRVLYTIPNFDTAGSGRALLNIAMRLDPVKFEPQILCMHDRGDFFKIVKATGIPVHLAEYTTVMRPLLQGLWRCWKISRLLRRISPDLIHSFHYSADYSEPLAARMAGIKWVYTKKSMSWGRSSRNAWRLRTALAHRVIAQNSDMLKQFFPGVSKATLIPRGVDVQSFAAGSHDESLCARYGVQPDDRVIICIANLVPVKGIEILVEAFGRLAIDFPNWRVWIVGDDRSDYGYALKEMVRKLDLVDRITFIGKQLNVKPFLDRAEVFVLPTRKEGRMEGSPVSLLEAMANGKVVIGSDVPGIRDQLSEFEGFRFEPDRVDKLCEILHRVMSQNNTRELGQRFSAYCRSNFSIEIEVSKHALLYQKECNSI